MGALENWLEQLDPHSRRSSRYSLIRFEEHVKGLGLPEFKTLDEMVQFQQEAQSIKDKYKIVNIAKNYVQKKGGKLSSMNTLYAHIRSFFFRNQATLEKIPTDFRPTSDSVQSQLNEDVFKTLVKASDLKDQAILLTLFQSMMDESRFQIFNTQYAEKLVKQLQEKSVDEPFRIDFLRGRKKNRRPYHTFIGHDGLEAWRVYFERERGWPKPGEPLVKNQFGKPVSSQALRRTHMYKLRRLGYVTEERHGHGVGGYGFGLHNIRDLTRSVLEMVQGKRLNEKDPIEEGFKTSCAEFWMGHTVDPLGYNQMQNLNPAWSLRQYRIAESRLNIISHTEHANVEKIVDDKIAEKLDELTPFFEETLATLYSAMTYGGEGFKSLLDNKSLKDKLEEMRHLPVKEKAKALKKLKEEVLQRAEDANMMLESQMTQKMTQEEKKDAVDTAEEAKKSR